METIVLFQWKNENSQELENIIVCDLEDEIVKVSCCTEKNYHLEIKNLVKHFSYISKGDNLFLIKDNEDNETIIKAPYSGIILLNEDFIYIEENIDKDIDGFLTVSYLKQLCTIYPNTIILKKTLFPNKINVRVDDFTKNVLINRDMCAGEEFGFNLFHVSIGFETIGTKHYMDLRYYPKRYKLNSKCSFQFLLEDNSIIVLNPISKPIKYKDYAIEYILKYSISFSELDLLEKKNFLKWQILNEDGIQVCCGDNVCCMAYADTDIAQKLSYDVFKDFFREYNGIIRENSAEVNEEIEECISKKKKSCSVYLMLDATNNFYKIGISNNPKYREHTLQSDKPTIDLIASKEYPTRLIAEAIESALHKVYNTKRIRGEWFNLEDEDVIHIKETLK